MYKVYRAKDIAGGEDSIFIVKDEMSVAISFGMASDALELEMAEGSYNLQGYQSIDHFYRAIDPVLIGEFEV